MAALADRVLSWTAVDDDPVRRQATATALRRFLLFEVLVHAWIAFLDSSASGLRTTLLLSAVLLTGIAGAGLLSGELRRAALGALVVLAARITLTFPDNYNHLLLEAWLVAAAAFFSTEDGEQQALLQVSRWLIVLVLFWSGMQKLLHGCYFRGQFLAYSIATEPHFAGPFALFFPEQVAALREIGPPRIGAGPYLVDSPLFIALSNLVVAVEIAVPILLLVPRTRTLAVVLGVLFLVAVESAARELVFGAMFVAGLLLFTPGLVFRRSIPVLGALLVGVLVVRALWPEVWIN